MLARMSNFTKGHCNVSISSSGSTCTCTAGLCAFDPTGAGDVESLKCHTCSHRMWDHADLLAGDFDVERGIGDPPPYDDDDEGSRSRRNDPNRFTNTLDLPTEPAQSHNHFYHRGEPVSVPVRYDAPLATSYNFPGDNINLPQYDAMHQQRAPLSRRPPGRTCTANLLIGIILGFVIVATPVIAYRVVTS